MRVTTITLFATAFLAATAVPAAAVTITNRDAESQRVLVCDEACGPEFGDDWGSAFDFWLQPGQSRSFSWRGRCFVGVYDDEGQPPPLGDIADADDDEFFRGDEAGEIVNGYAHRKP